MKKPRYLEIEPGEVRRVCLECDTPIRHGTFCVEHSGHKYQPCEKCGKIARGPVCKKCHAGHTPEFVLLDPSQIRDGKRVLTEHDRPFVEKWWSEGFTSPEIASKLGLSLKNPRQLVASARGKRGWDLPYRNPWAVEHGREMARRVNEKQKVAA